MTNADLFERNLQVFAERLPDLHRRLVEVSSPLSSVVVRDGAAVDIDLNPGLLYKRDSQDLAREQVAAFVAEPFQVNYNIPQAPDFDSLISRRVHQGILMSMRDHQIGALPISIVTPPGYLVVLGVGLGHHLPLLVDSLRFQHIIVFEAFPEFLLHSLRAIDWGQLFARCDAEGRKLHVMCESRPEVIADRACGIFSTNNPTLLDGCFFFNHIPLWNLTEAKRRIINELPRQMVAAGYFEDERKMLCNTVTNLHRREFRLLEGKIRQRKNIPVFLIGAGPSFDEAADFVEAWRDHAIIISSGSALQPLLKRGIIPDYQTELENSPDQYDKTRHILESNANLFPEGKFTGIKLIASTTVNPRVPYFYDEVYFFFRDAVTSTTSLGREWVTLQGTAPTVANTSMSAAACLGFGDVYLFGFDCGWRDNKDHHAKDTIYYTSDTFKTESMRSQYSLRGNFGGNVQTDLVFDWSKNLLEQSIRAFRMQVFNCSDGAFIEGAVPKVPEALEFTTVLDREAIISAIREASPYFPAKTFFKDFDIEPLRHEISAYVSDILGIIDRCLTNDVDYADFVDEVWAVICRVASPSRLAVGLIYFTTASALKQSALFINRVADPELRLKVTQDFLRLMRELHQEMLEQVLTIFDEMDGMVAGECDPEWTKGLATTPGTSY